MITISYYHYWKDSDTDNYFTEFIKKNIGDVKIVANTSNPDILISSCWGDIKEVKELKAKCKIFFYGENLERFPIFNDEKVLYDVFDLIVGFKETDISLKQVRFPLWLMYYSYYNYDEKDNILSYIQKRYNENIKKHKEFFCTIVARHDWYGQRTKIYDVVCKYGDIYSPSTYRNNTKSIGKGHKEKIDYISRGIYNICPENSCNDNYFTEKIFQAFEAGTIPIYWATDLPEVEIINRNKYCFCDLNNREELEKSIVNVTKNPNQYIEGDLFTKNAGEKIDEYYSTLKRNIIMHIDK